MTLGKPVFGQCDLLKQMFTEHLIIPYPCHSFKTIIVTLQSTAHAMASFTKKLCQGKTVPSYLIARFDFSVEEG